MNRLPYEGLESYAHVTAPRVRGHIQGKAAMLKSARIVVAAALFAIPSVAFAQHTNPPKPDKPKEKAGAGEATGSLKTGDKAPALTIDKWVKGDQVKGFEKGKVYVVEFWATWCPPCRESIPHLTEMQHKHKDVTFIGVASSEHGSDASTEDNLRQFVKKEGKSMDYRVGYDPQRKMSKTWMEPAGQNGIPCAFVVDGDGKIAWIGHPMELEANLDKVVAKTNGNKKG